MKLPGVKTKIHRDENMVTISVRPTDEPAGTIAKVGGKDTMTGQQMRRNAELVESAKKAIEKRIKEADIPHEDLWIDKGGVGLVLK